MSWKELQMEQFYTKQKKNNEENFFISERFQLLLTIFLLTWELVESDITWKIAYYTYQADTSHTKKK